ncbi:MAG: hypothetical protein QW802_01170 [Candidatus Altiarchaeota archaeon]
MKNKKIIFAILVIGFLLFAVFGVSGDNQRNIERNSQIKGSLTQNRTEILERLEEKHRNRYEKIEKKVDNSTIEGQLISALNQARRLEFQNMKLSLREIGYHGEVDDFAVAFNRQINALKEDIRNRLNLSNEGNLTRRAMFQVALRELARIRNEKIAQLKANASDEDVMFCLRNLSKENFNFTSQIRYMNRNFKNMILEIAKNGTVEEKRALKEQIRNYLQDRKSTIKSQIGERLRLIKMHRERIREMLRNDTLENFNYAP